MWSYPLLSMSPIIHLRPQVSRMRTLLGQSQRIPKSMDIRTCTCIFPIVLTNCFQDVLYERNPTYEKEQLATHALNRYIFDTRYQQLLSVYVISGENDT